MQREDVKFSKRKGENSENADSTGCGRDWAVGIGDGRGRPSLHRPNGTGRYIEQTEAVATVQREDVKVSKRKGENGENADSTGCG